MRIHKLRTAFSILCGILSLLVIGLWVRSYWLSDHICYRPTAATAFRAFSNEGAVQYGDISKIVGLLGSPPAIGWSLRTSSHAGHRSEIADSSPFNRTFRGFNGSLYPGSQFPYWLLVLIPVALGVTPWVFKWNWQFSLRTLLIAVTLIAVLLWLILSASV